MSSINQTLLSSQQRRLQALQRHAPGDVYGVRATVRVRGPLDVDRWCAALRQVDVEAVRVEPPDGVARARASHETWWHVSASALVADAAALRLLIARAFAAHDGRMPDAREQGEEDEADALTYAAYAEWQESLSSDPDTAAARQYWAAQPAPDASNQRLPMWRAQAAEGDRTQAPRASTRVARTIDARLTRRLDAAARTAGNEARVLLLSAWQVLLWRHRAGATVEVGVRLDGRAHPVLQEVEGPCARYVPVRIEIDPRWSMTTLAERVGSIVREHEIWQDGFAWDRLDGASAASTASHAFGFDWHDDDWYGDDEDETGAFAIEALAERLEPFDLRIGLQRRADVIECVLESAGGHYGDEDVALLADRYITLLGALTRRLEARLADLELLPPDEVTWLLVRGAGVQDDWPADTAVHALIEAQARRQPTMAAVIAGDVRLTYADLDRRAGALAARIRAAGAMPCGRVGICLPRGVDQIVALLAVLKAGAAFVPLDPNAPADRLAFTLADAQIRVLVSDVATARLVPPDGLTLVSIDATSENGEDAQPLATEPPAFVDAAQPAYIIYTSGSTGRPKGVVVSHRNVVHSTDARRTYYRRPAGTYLLVSPIAFDSAMAGVFWTLFQGGTLVLPEDADAGDPTRLRHLVERHEVTHALCLPSLYAWVLDAERLSMLRSLQVVIVAGESCPTALAERHRSLLSGVELHNEYGPTECSVWSTVYEGGTADERGGVPIGRPVPRARIYVTERPWRLSPSAVPGEGVIGGDGVADGYLDRPDLTAERFVPDPWSERPGARAYRTGDSMRWLPQDQIEFLGRVDRQVKLRGYRIELEEIDASIGAHPDVRECTVIVRRDERANDVLTAYIALHVPVGGERKGEAAAAIRALLAGRLPAYMVPGAIVLLDSLPKTPNGKIDRARLPAPTLDRDAQPPAHPPESATEMAIAAVWQELLGRTRIDIDDNFFDLGGHSIMAIAVHTRLQRASAPHVRLVDLFEHPTVRALAQFVDASAARAAAVTQAEVEGEAVIAAEPAPASTTDAAQARARQQALQRKRRAARAS